MRFKQFLIWFDQGFNVLLGGYADETISAHAWRCRNAKRRWMYARKFIDMLFFWQPDHCQIAYESELLRRQFPIEYRNTVSAGSL